jgi:hypothetical protein
MRKEAWKKSKVVAGLLTVPRTEDLRSWQWHGQETGHNQF